jgi:arabinan endo-1,5-alpha-L-arabinosidase
MRSDPTEDSTMKLSLTTLALLALFSAQLGCGGGSGGGGSVPPNPGPDNGTLADLNDGFQYKFQNASSGLLLDIANQSQTAGAALVQASDSGTNNQLWHAMPMGNHQVNVENLLTHQVIGIMNASPQPAATALQWADNGTPDHLWEFFVLKDGNYLIKNVNSNLYLENRNSDTTPAAIIDQAARATTGTGCTCQEWTLTSTGNSPYPAPLGVSGTGIGVHDPFMLKDPSGTYWLYGTHNTIASSTDFVNFSFNQTCTTQEKGGYPFCPDIGPDFASWSGLQTPPSLNNGANTDMWAPDVLYANGTYYQYYAIPIEPHSGPQAVILLATSANPAGPWTDAGQIIESCGTTTGCTTTFNAIDASPFIDLAGNWWMVFGSFTDGIHLIQLDPSTGQRLQSNSTIYTIAQRGNPSAGEEGPFIYLYNGWYYYFAPINICCNGVNSTYRIIVGRSQTVTGPYLDRGGIDLMQGGGTILLSAHANINGPGGQSVFTDGAQPTLVYHYYDGNNNGAPTLGLNRLGFDSDGWPFVQ